jgi:hypothetical protein
MLSEEFCEAQNEIQATENHTNDPGCGYPGGRESRAQKPLFASAEKSINIMAYLALPLLL